MAPLSLPHACSLRHFCRIFFLESSEDRSGLTARTATPTTPATHSPALCGCPPPISCTFPYTLYQPSTDTGTSLAPPGFLPLPFRTPCSCLSVFVPKHSIISFSSAIITPASEQPACFILNGCLARPRHCLHLKCLSCLQRLGVGGTSASVSCFWGTFLETGELRGRRTILS